MTTFGHGAHRCPAQRFSVSAIVRTVARLLATFEMTPAFTEVVPLPAQIGGVARSADPCLVSYRGRGSRRRRTRARGLTNRFHRTSRPVGATPACMFGMRGAEGEITGIVGAGTNSVLNDMARPWSVSVADDHRGAVAEEALVDR